MSSRTPPGQTLPASKAAYQESTHVSATSNAPNSSAANASVTGVSPNLLWTSTIVAGIAIGIAVWCVIQLQETEREARMLEYYIMELDGKLMKGGILNPSESLAAQKKEQGK
jgi:uncharacterized protein HemX